MFRLILLLVAGTALLAVHVKSQARFMKPISRASAFRDSAYNQFNPPQNYDDHRINCGNLIQEQVVGGNCGVCGDAYTQATPRTYEIGGSGYREGMITGNYVSGSVIEAEIDVENSKMGYMEWRLCSTPFSGETQTCFNRFLLENADGSGTKTYVTDVGTYTTHLRLPAGVTCRQCVIQWNYRVANNWGTCPNGTSGIGCGPQETFRACSDIVIS